MQSTLQLLSNIENTSLHKLKKYSSAKQKILAGFNSQTESQCPNSNPNSTCETIHIQQQIESIERQQLKMMEKCEKVIEQLTREIELKGLKNQQLEREVIDLRQEVQSSGEDLKIIVAYINRMKVQQRRALKTRPQMTNKTTVVNSTKDSGRTELSLLGVKVLTNVANGSSITPNKIKLSSGLRSGKIRRHKSDNFDL